MFHLVWTFLIAFGSPLQAGQESCGLVDACMQPPPGSEVGPHCNFDEQINTSLELEKRDPNAAPAGPAQGNETNY